MWAPLSRSLPLAHRDWSGSVSSSVDDDGRHSREVVAELYGILLLMIYIHTHTIHTYIHACMHTYIHTYIHTCLHEYMHVCMYVCMNV